ncbi:MAG: hypothetical protein OQK04_07265 [Kangiellaceae bacterium]|nr:hypothetical protein [Kangiellaceae bacterium]MCW8998498.1 hypothetical protein [Kangiellaceae bacterium]
MIRASRISLKSILVFFISTWSLCTISEDIKDYPLGEWPLLAKYEETPCLDVDDDRLDVLAQAYADRTTIHTEFILASFGGKFFVNPKVHKGWGTITFSMDSASKQVEESGKNCFQLFKVGIKAWPEKYKKIYIVVDQTVKYEVPLY